ncbi:MAG: cytochrome c3 family protein [Bacteroidales bacterium]|nr:cytochrome c3 family protein [Bacteroidales bacterium]
MGNNLFLPPKAIMKLLLIPALILLMGAFKLDDKTKKSFKNAESNENCLKCHGQSKYSYDNPESGQTVFQRMYREAIINRDLFYESNHSQFKCSDCHSEDYDSFPHPGRLRMETKYLCIDCHGDDPKYAKFNFEKIETEFAASVHSSKHSEDFTCWMCHNPHTYKISARSEDKIEDVVAYDNAICLDCHSDASRYELLTTKQNPNILKKHEWLPNQALHFSRVRCIECHARVNDSLMVAHNIQPKAKAVKRCVECHSTNSMLMSTLYKFKVQEGRNKSGFYNGVIMNESYVIGANRNYYLGLLSLVMFGCVMAGIIIHATLRIIKRKHNG